MLGGAHPSGLPQELTVVTAPEAAVEAVDVEVALDITAEAVMMAIMMQDMVKDVEEKSESSTASSSMIKLHNHRNSNSQEARDRWQRNGGKL